MLDTVIQEKLSAIGRRWRRLIWLRGICGALATLLFGFLLHAALDWFFILPDKVRFLLTGATYLGTALVFWFYAGRQLFRAPDLRELARKVENAAPSLREDLLSAIELGESEAIWDSAVFRELLQRTVAERIRDLTPKKILPPGLIKWWIRGAIVAVALCVVLFAVPRLRFDRLVLRAAAPFSNIDRVSRFQVMLLEPANEHAVVPRGDLVPIVVDVSGGEPHEVVLQTFRPGKAVETLLMTAQEANSRFSAGIQMDDDAVEYRIRAGDALTHKFKLTARPRPHVVKFEKVYNFPAYTKLAPKRVIEESGDLIALQGTQVDLKLHVDQPVKEAELQITFGRNPARLKLAPSGTNELTGRMPMNLAGMFQVRLVAAGTAFENKFSPQYELRPTPDLVPSVELLQPQKDQLAPPDEVIAVRGRAKDDYGLAKVSQLVRVNNGNWTEATLAQPTNAEANVSSRWDLFPLKLKPGDRVAIKLVAIDSHANKGESAPVQITITSPNLDIARLKALETRQAAQDTLAVFHKSLQELERTTSQALGKITQGLGELQAKQGQVNVIAGFEQIEQTSAKAWSQLKAAAKVARPGREADDLALAAIVLSRVKDGLLDEAKHQIQTLDLGTKNAEAKNELQEAAGVLHRAAELASQLEHSASDLLAAERADVSVENAAQLLSEQKRMNARAATMPANDKSAWEELGRRQMGAAQESQLLEGLLKNLGQQTTASIGERVNRVQDNLIRKRAALEKLIAAGDTGKPVVTSAQNLQTSLENALAELVAVKAELHKSANQARALLTERAGGATHTQISALQQSVKALTDLRKQKTPDLRQIKLLEHQTDVGWSTLVEQLKSRADFEETRGDVDSFFVADLGKAAEALGALRAAFSSDAKVKQAVGPLGRLAKAFRPLEASHDFARTTAALRELAGQERYEPLAAPASTARPRDWRWLADAWKTLPQEVRDAGLPGATAQNIATAAAGPVAGQIDAEMNARFARERGVLPVSDKLEKLLILLMQAQRELAAAAQEHRDEVAKLSPKLSEQMEGLAKTNDKLEQKTSAQAEAAAKHDAAKSKEEARKLFEAQKDLAKQIEDLRDALRREANVQDAMAAEGREKARDADDASAMLREPPVKARDALRKAASNQADASPEKNLRDAVEQQKQTGEALKQLAKHFKNAEAGKSDLSRSALRQAEEKLGLKELFDEQNKKNEMLAELSKLPTDQQMKQLEQELKKNQPMQKELSAIAKNALKDAAAMLTDAAQNEKNLANDLTSAAKNEGRQQSNLADSADRLRADAKRIAERDVPAATQKSAEAKVDNADALAQGAESLAKVALQSPSEKPTPAEVAKKVAEMIPALKSADTSLRMAVDTAAKASKDAAPNSAAQAARAQSAKAADAASQLLKDAKDLLDRLQSAQDGGGIKLAQAAKQQEDIGQTVKSASDTLDRGMRHEERLNSPKGEMLEQVSTGTKKLAEQSLPPVPDAVAKSKDTASASAPVQKAEKEVAAAAAALQAALEQAAPEMKPDKGQENKEGQNSNSSQSGGDQKSEDAKAMARALDRLDEQMNGKPGQQGDNQNQPGNEMAKSMMQQAQAKAGREARDKAKSSNGSGASGFYDAQAKAEGGQLAELGEKSGGKWGKLRAQVAEDLVEGKRENVSGEYRTMIDTYFKVIAEKARGANP